MQAPGPTLETERLILRPTAAADFEPWATLMADPEVARYIGGVQPRATVWRGMMTMAGAWALDGFAMFSVVEKASGRWIGRVGPWYPDGWPGTEVGWALLREAWGQGFAREAAIASINWAFDHLGWTEVIHTVDAANEASARLAQRLGSTLRGRVTLPPPLENYDARVWGQSAAQWATQRHKLGERA